MVRRNIFGRRRNYNRSSTQVSDMVFCQANPTF